MFRKGEGNQSAVMTAEDVRELRVKYADTRGNTYMLRRWSQRKLADWYGISRSEVGRIVRRETWQDV